MAGYSQLEGTLKEKTKKQRPPSRPDTWQKHGKPTADNVQIQLAYAIGEPRLHKFLSRATTN